jgi:hypothetical protein
LWNSFDKLKKYWWEECDERAETEVLGKELQTGSEFNC